MPALALIESLSNLRSDASVIVALILAVFVPLPSVNATLDAAEKEPNDNLVLACAVTPVLAVLALTLAAAVAAEAFAATATVAEPI